MFFIVGRYRIPWIPGLALLAGAGAVDLAKQVRARRRRGVAARALLVAFPLALCWRPAPDPAPDRWAHAEIGLALAYLEAGELEPAIDALDDASAMSPGAAARVATLRIASEFRGKLAAAIARSWARERDPLRRARWLRQLPASGREPYRLLELERYLHPDSTGPVRELGLWHLGRGAEPRARREALALLETAAKLDPSDRVAGLLIALIEPSHHAPPPPRDSDDAASSARFRLARASLRGR